MRLLIIGTLNGQIGTATRIAVANGAKVAHVENIATGLDHLRSGRGADLIMIDVGLEISGLMDQMQSERICVPVVACGIGTDARAAVTAIQAGAKEYIPLPPDAELIAAVLQAVADEANQVVFQDPAMHSVIELADQVAKSDASILITGESGVGKEVIANYVHRHSNRSDKSFISINCAAIPENLLESELFGHEKGAFTGAIARRIGKFEEANGGTLLLDEISEMDVRLQAKLLRAIQERTFDRVGGNKPVKVDIRIIATSNRDLHQAVDDGHFREDLLYRLNVVNLKVPPLRERQGDIVALSEHFVVKYSEANGIAPRKLSSSATKALGRYSWQGNVRELENTIHRAILLASGEEITEEAIRLPDGTRVDEVHVSPADSAISQVAMAAENAARTFVGSTVAEVERDLILNTLDHCLGNRTHAAKILGISIRTLRNKLNQYGDDGVDVPQPGVARAGSY
jgi:two-component system, response regulator FlrC